MGPNAASHHPPGSRFPITVQLFPADQAANAAQRATVTTQTHLHGAATYPLNACHSLCSPRVIFSLLTLMFSVFLREFSPHSVSILTCRRGENVCCRFLSAKSSPKGFANSRQKVKGLPNPFV